MLLNPPLNYQSLAQTIRPGRSLNVRAPATLASLVVSARPNVTANALPVAVVHIQELHVITAMAKAGENESKFAHIPQLRTRARAHLAVPSSCHLLLLRLRNHHADPVFFCRTAEDLTATSRRLARYEALLAEILPMVSSEVRDLIEDARDQVGE